jgi:hypothetical protein
MKSEDKAKNEKKAVDVNRFFWFEMDFSKLQEAIEESCYQHGAFWELLKSDKASREALYLEGSRIIKVL